VGRTPNGKKIAAEKAGVAATVPKPLRLKVPGGSSIRAILNAMWLNFLSVSFAIFSVATVTCRFARCMRHVFFLVGAVFSGSVAAATYTLPGTLPSGCTSSSSTAVTCPNLSLAWADTIVVSNANLTLTVTNALSFGGNNSINASSTASGFKINAKTVSATNNITLKGDIAATNTLTLSSNTNAIGGNITAGGTTSVGGSITGTVTTTGSFSSVYATTVTGSISASDITTSGGSTFGSSLTASSGDVDTGSGDRIAGGVSAVAGKVTLKSSVMAGGSVTAKNEVTLESNAAVTGSVTSTNDKVTLKSSGSSVGGGITAKKAVTIGSGCTVTGNITTDDDVKLESSNSRVNGNIVAKKKVELGSSTTVTGNVTSTNDDVELKSSGSTVNSCITADAGKTIKFNWGTSAGGVCCLSGSTCSNSCVVNGSGSDMPPLCQAITPCITDLFTSGTLDTAFWNVAGIGYTPTVVTTPAVSTNRLRLTDNAGGRSTYAQIKKWFPGANNKVVVEFDYFAWGGSNNGGDGIAVVFSDASVSPSPGGYGGSIGYANRTGSDGFGGGWLGIGLDEFGNYPGTGEGRKGYPAGYTPPAGANATAAARANSIAVRGSGSGQTGYVLLANTGTLATAVKTGTTTTDSATKHRYRITLDHSNSVNAYVTVERDTTGAGSSYATVIPAFDAKATNSGQAAMPTNMLLSFTAGTGGATNNHEVANVKICATKIDPVGNASPAANFECMDDYLSQASYNNRQVTPTSRNPIYTKLARAAFKLRVVPLDSTGAVKGDYIPAGGSSKDVTVEIFDDSTTPRPACNAYSGTPVATQTATLVSGVMTTGNFTINRAYTKLMCRVTDNTIPASPVRGCSSDQFAVRPGAVTLTPGTAMATGPSASATPTLKAGASFTLRATTSTSSSDVYSGALTQNTSAFTAQPTTQDTTLAAGGAIGSLSHAALVANAAAIAATYSEVGYLYLAAGAYRDLTYTAVDGSTDCASGSTSVTLSSGKYGCVIGNTAAVTFGRFIPDRFTVTPGTPTAACTVHPAAGAGYTPKDFTYFSQTDGFSTPFTLTAVNAAGGTTQNYTGVFAKLGSGGWIWGDASIATGLRFGTSTALPAGSTLAAALLGGLAVAPAGTWSNGVLGLTNVKHQISRPTALTGQTDVIITTQPVDADGVSTASATAVNSSATALRFGRLRAINVYGSDRLPLSVPLQTQYFDTAANTFLPNKDDSCTSLSLPAARNLSVSPPSDGAASRNFYPVITGGNQLTSADTTVSISAIIGGVGSIALTAPGKNGWTDTILSVPNYLKGNWGNCWGQTVTADLNDDLPCARATFGVYKSPLIYRRENY
jgi:MSHA biogenesis protein MshQ